MGIQDIRKNIPQGGETYDVIVAGGGPAGIGAAYGAAKQGARVLILEGRSFFGGVAAVCLWMPMNRLFVKGESRGGVHEDFVNRLRAYGEDACVRGIDNHIAKDGLDIHPDYLRLVAYQLLESVGCHYRLYSPVVETLKEGNAVKGVAVWGKDGRKEFYAPVVVDSTGDADVAAFAGAEIVKGDTQGKMMPISLNFALDNVDGEKALAYINDYEGQKKVFNELVFQAHEEGYCMARWYFFDRSSVDGTISVNNGGPMEAWDTGMDGTSVQDLVIVERLGIEIATDFVRFCRDKKIPGLEDCSLMRVGANVGVRETRRIVGDYVFSEKDATEGTKFDDAIVRRYGERIDSQNLEISKEMVSGHQLPYRCLLPRGVEGLLVAGRCASYDQVALTAGRSMGNMMAMGQSAGVAAGLAVLQQVTPRNLEVAKAQKALVDMGVDLGL